MLSGVFRKHCTDETLLALVDGELPRGKAHRARRHLEVCWQCRSRLSEIEEQVRRFSRAFSDQVFPGPGRVQRAREAVLSRTREQEQGLLTVPRFQSAGAPVSWLGRAMATVALAALAVTAGLTVFHSPPVAPGDPSPEELLARSRRLELSQLRQPVHQEFDVEVLEPGLDEARRTGRLTIWSNPKSDDFASRYAGPDGEIRHALFRPAGRRSYTYRADESAAFVPCSRPSAGEPSLVAVAAPAEDLEGLERAFLRWLEARRWRPIAMSDQWESFADGAEVAFRAERLDGGLFAVTAERMLDGRRVTLWMELDQTTTRPRLVRVRFESRGRALEIRLKMTASSVVPAGRAEEFFQPANLARSFFGPGIKLPGSEREPAPLAAEGRGRPRPSTTELLSAEIEARYALHRMGICLDGSLDVSRHPDGFVDVRAVVESMEQRRRLLAALTDIGTSPLIRIRVEQPDGHAVADQIIRKLTVTSPEHVPAEGVLRSALAGRADVEDEITRISNEVLSVSQGALADAWALRQLAEICRSADWPLVRTQSRWLLEEMVEDHVRPLRTGLERMRQLLIPVAGDWRSPEAAAGGGVWPESSVQVYPAAERMHAEVLALFAGGGEPDATITSLETAWRDVMARAAGLEAHAARAEPVTAQ